MKFSFLYPNLASEGCINAAIAILSSVLKKEGHEVFLFDTTFYEKGNVFMGAERESLIEFKKTYRSKLRLNKGDIFCDFREHVKKYQPDILCVSCISGQFDFVVELLKSLGALRPFTLIGGKYPTICPEKVIANPYIDGLCRGEGEEAILDFVSAWEKGETTANIPGFWVKEEGKIYKNPLRRLIQDLSKIPYFDLELFDERHLLQPFDGVLRKAVDLEVSRGCPYQCTYCINPVMKKIFKGQGTHYRKKPVEPLLEEMAYYKEKHSIELVKINDDCFLAMEGEYLDKFVSEYPRQVGLPFIACTRPETVNEEVVSRLKGTAVPFQISIGIESGDDKIRTEVCKRNVSEEKIIDAFEILKRNGIRTCAFLMIGFPYETRSQIFRTINLGRKVKSDIVVVSVFYPFEGVPLRDICIKEGFLKEEFEGSSNLVSECVLSMPQLSKEAIVGLRKTFILYIRAPKLLWPVIRLAEGISFLSRIIYAIIHKYYDYRFNKYFKPLPLFPV